MRKPKFTPGPWGDGHTFIVGPDGKEIFTVDGYDDEMVDCSPGDFALVKAAPYMYEACEKVAAMIREESVYSGHIKKAEILEAALSKARGES